MPHTIDLVFITAVVNVIFLVALLDTVSYIQRVPKIWPYWKGK